MRNRFLILGTVAFVAYVLGSRVSSIRTEKGQSVMSQLVEKWNDPKAKKEREKAAKKAKKALERARRKWND